MMRRLTVFLTMMSAAASAQTHVVKKPETVVRAIAVYEWTGPEAKPTASRLVPVSIFIDAQLQDAGLYMARPVPFALDRGTVFEMQRAGVPEGALDLAFQRHLEAASETPFDDGWLGYGVFKPAAKEPVTALKQKGPLPEVVASGGTRPHFGNKPDSTNATTPASSDDSGRPTMKRRADSTDAGATSTGSTNSDDSAKTSTTSTADSNRPVLQKRGDSSDGGSTAPGSATTADSSSGADSTDDPHRPTMRRRSDTTDSGSTTSSSGRSPAADASDDVDRPTLKKRTPAQSKAAQKKGDQASVTSTGSLNDDPDRPTLHRGSAAGLEIPPLNGLPADMQQMVAVSDAKDRPEHDFTRAFESEVERAEVLGKMQDEARARLAKYDVPAPLPVSAPVPAAVKSRPGGRTRKQVINPPPAPVPGALTDEKLNGYTLSYGGAATFVYTAASPGAGGATRYVSIVAQRETLGELKVATASVTDSTHLDRTPWMRLVDVVDAEASNRASLLFEMRGRTSRQFALYRVIGAEAQQVFETGTTE